MKREIVLWLLVSAAGWSADSGKAYPVSEVVKVRTAVEFECRIKGYPYAESARFRVQVRDVKANEELPAEEAAEYLRERLKNAEQIVLKNVKLRNYFRAEADVVVDGKDLAGELIALGLAASTRPVPEKPQETPEPRQVAQRPEPRRRYQPVQQDNHPESPRSAPRYVSLQSLLDTPVDFSIVNDETTLAEALQILSDSVRPRLPLVILWNDLQTNALVEKDMPIGIAGVGSVTLKHALKLVLHSVSQRAQTELLLSLQGNVMTIGTQKGLLVKSTNRMYSVEDIVYAPFGENMDN